MKIAVKLFLLLTLITGLIYPSFITLIATTFFWEKNNKNAYSLLIGQPFSAPQYFWGRPSATLPFPYNATNSSGSNLGPSNPEFLSVVKTRIATLKKADPKNKEPIPIDLVTASGSGLDPDISPAAAFYQISRVAKARQLSKERLQSLVKSHIQGKTWGILGEPRVNVLELNMALDQQSSLPLKKGG